MNTPQFLLGVGMICVGIFIVILQTKRFKNRLKDRWGYEQSTLIGGIGFVVGGIIVIVKSF
jgi:hypothetical protein